jgi:hypothetical protein
MTLDGNSGISFPISRDLFPGFSERFARPPPTVLGPSKSCFARVNNEGNWPRRRCSDSETRRWTGVDPVDGGGRPCEAARPKRCPSISLAIPRRRGPVLAVLQIRNHSRPRCRLRLAGPPRFCVPRKPQISAPCSRQNPLRLLRIQAIRDLAEVHKADRVNGQKPIHKGSGCTCRDLGPVPNPRGTPLVENASRPLAQTDSQAGGPVVLVHSSSRSIMGRLLGFQAEVRSPITSDSLTTKKSWSLACMPIPFLRTEFNENASKLVRQREDVHGVAAAGRVRLGSQADTEGSDRAATSGDSDVLASVDRIRHGPADDL